jgi:DNA uptake protein ComE-like DNA-binding protein
MKKPEITVFDKERTEGVKLVSQLPAVIKTLTVKTEADYQTASEYLTQVMSKRQQWGERFSKVLSPQEEAVKQAKKALAAARLLFDEVDEPMMKMEAHIKSVMRDFKLEERRLLLAAEAERQAELAKLQKEAEDKRQAEARAKTPAMAARTMEARLRIQEAIASKQTEAPPTAVKAAGSQARVLRKYRVIDMAKFVLSMVTVAVPEDTLFNMEISGLGENNLSLLAIDKAQMDAKFKLDNPPVGEWMPGVECYEDINIAGSR